MKANRVFFPNLDGLRFLCFLSVFFYHSFHTTNETIKAMPAYKFFANGIFRNGNLGVNFFFVLSGFLITFLLIKERECNSKINIPYFWMRRILRIWPLYFFCVLFGFLIFPYIKLLFGELPSETANIYSFLTFTSNFDLIKSGLPDSSVLGVLWSIAIEEQFYFFWPAILTFVKRENYNYIFILIILVSFVFRFFFNTPLYHEHHSISCIADMAVGALGASLSMNDIFLIRIKRLKKTSIILLYITFCLVYFFRKEMLMFNDIIRIFERVLIAFLILGIILEQNFSENSLFKMSNYKSISRLGTITYGLYCLHFIGILITIKTTAFLGFNSKLWQVVLIETFLALLISITLARISFKYFESYFLKLKHKFTFIKK